MTQTTHRLFPTFIAALLALAACGCGDASERWSKAQAFPDDPAVSAFDVVDVATDAKGNGIVVWSQTTGDRHDSGAYTVWARRFTRGDGWGPATKLGSPGGRRGAGHASVRMNAAGSAIAVWGEWAGDLDDQTGVGIWAARFDPQSGWEEPVLVGPDGFDASVAVNDRGQAMVVWTWWDNSLPLYPSAVWATAYDPKTDWEPPSQLDQFCVLVDRSDGEGRPTIGGDAYDPHVAMNDRGEAIAVWQGTGFDTLSACNPGDQDPWDPFSTYGPKVSRYVPGAGWEPPTALSSDWGYANVAPLDMDGQGRGLVGGSAYNPADGWRSLDFVSNGNASVSVAESGHALVVWREGEWVLGSRFLPDQGWSATETIGVGFSPPSTVTEGPTNKSLGIMDSNGIDLAINDSGQCTVVWHLLGGLNYNPPQTPWRFQVWANRFEPGVGWGTPNALSTDPTIDAFLPRIAMDEQGRSIAVWQQARGSIYAQDPIGVWWSRSE